MSDEIALLKIVEELLDTKLLPIHKNLKNLNTLDQKLSNIEHTLDESRNDANAYTFPPLEFPLSLEMWEKYQPSVEEYRIMVKEHWQRKGIDLHKAMAELPARTAMRLALETKKNYNYITLISSVEEIMFTIRHALEL